jgi:hypothetical protein
MNLKKIK